MPSFSISDLMGPVQSSASNARLKAENPIEVRGEAVGQVRRDRRRTKEQSEVLIREFLWAQTEAVVFLDICDYLQRRPSPILRQIVEELVKSGEVIQEQDFGAGPLIARNLYRVNR